MLRCCHNTRNNSYASNQTVITALLLFIAVCQPWQTLMANDDEQPANSPTIRHSDLSVFRAADGTLKPIRTTDDWAQRRAQIIAGAEAAMGPLPKRDNLPAFDVRITEDVRVGEVRRLTMTIAVEDSDRLPLDLYLPKSVMDTVDVEQLLNAESPSKLAAVVALHPTEAAGKSLRGGRITPGEWERRTGLRLRFVYRRRGPSLLVAEGRLNTKGRAVASRSKTGRGRTTVPIFLLVPQVKLPK
ncbi:MAG TPA: DUF6441 family protein, partial [Planctomycetaceae bacterium]|nr:DUF6441 family protein [Planctomycetaceae bacterium]